MMTRMTFARLVTLLVTLVTLVPTLSLWTTEVRAATSYQPPDIRGHVTDVAGKLLPSQVDALNKKLADYRKCSTNHVAVFIAASLEGNTIEDVAYVTFNTWKIGAAGKDNGVLLVLAPTERKNFIATGKGVGGELPDVEAFHILRDKVTPRLKEDKFFAAVDDGTTAIGRALGGCAIEAAVAPSATAAPTSTPAENKPPPDPPAPSLSAGAMPHSFARIALTGGAVFLVLMALWGLRANRFSYLVVGLMTAIFGHIITGFYSSFDVFDVSGALEAFSVIWIILVLVNIVVWLIRLRGPKRDDGYWNPSTAGSSDTTSSTFSSSSSSFDTSSSSSFSSSSSSSDSSYSGGGGSTGGGGAGDSY